LPLTHILLPHKETLTEQNAGAVANIVTQHAKLSKSEHQFQVFGQKVDNATISGVNYVSLSPRFTWIKGKNIGLARAYVEQLNKIPNPDLVEVHGRAKVARYICQKRPDLPIILYLHNDPREMRGAQTTEERLWLIKHLAGVICVSDYIKACFLDGLPQNSSETDTVQSVLNGTAKSDKLHLPKDKSIVIIGRMIPEKGILPACQAISRILPAFPDWRLNVVGGRHFKQTSRSHYEHQIEQAVSVIKEQVHFHGFQPTQVTKALQSKAAISVVPSLWAEPCGLAGLEALAAGSALLTTDRGGIPEYASGRAVMIKLNGTERNNQDAEAAFQDALAQELHKLIGDDLHREALQHKAANGFPFTAENMVVDANKARQFFLSRFTNTQL
jgi:glycosyltransferase involved in cell wall biosynthesis